MQINDFDQLVATLRQENLPFRSDRDAQIVELAVHHEPLHSEMVIRWEIELLLAQFIVAFPFQVPSERFSAVEHALTIVNHRLIMPGFGLDNERGILYFRLVTPRSDDGSLSYEQIQRFIAAAVDTLVDFYELFVGVVTEGQNADELLDAISPELSKLPEQPGSPAPDTATAATAVTATSIEASGDTQVTGATTQEPAAAAKAAEIKTAEPGIHPQTPAVAPPAAEEPPPAPTDKLTS